MKRKQIKIEIPQYLTIGDYQKLKTFNGEGQYEYVIHLISSLTNQPEHEVRQWDARALVKVAKLLIEKSNPKQEYHPLIEFNGILYGYRSLEKFTLGEYADLERLANNPDKNLDQIAALLYRPVTEHKFDSLSFTIKQSLKMVNNKVENVFDWYTVEDYDSEQRRFDAIMMKDFPVHIILGAMDFFLTIVNLSLTDTLFSTGKMDKKRTEALKSRTMKNLLQNTGAGSGLYTNSVKPIYFRLPVTNPSLN